MDSSYCYLLSFNHSVLLSFFRIFTNFYIKIHPTALVGIQSFQRMPFSQTNISAKQPFSGLHTLILRWVLRLRFHILYGSHLKKKKNRKSYDYTFHAKKQQPNKVLVILVGLTLQTAIFPIKNQVLTELWFVRKSCRICDILLNKHSIMFTPNLFASSVCVMIQSRYQAKVLA